MRVFLNEDLSHYCIVNQGKTVLEKDIRDYMRMYKGSCVTDFLFNVNCSVSTSRSSTLETLMDKYTTKHENGVDVVSKDNATLEYVDVVIPPIA